MKTIKWELPFKTMHYLNSLAEELAQNPSIILITGIQDEEGNINSCNIGLREPVSDEALVHLGITIGVHSVSYPMALQQTEEDRVEIEDTKVRAETKGAVITVVEEEEVETVNVEDVITEIIEIKKKPGNQPRLMLRKILNNFKKSK